MTPKEAQEHLASSAEVEILDVREPHEFEHANIGGKLIPLRELQGRLPELSSDKTYLVLCHHGTRSRMATQLLLSQGFRAVNIVGGIHRWSLEVDPKIPTY